MFELNAVVDGVTNRELLEGLLRRTRNEQRRAEYQAALEVPLYPDALEYLWRAFCRLHARRTIGFSLNPIAWTDIAAFSTLTGLRFAPWEIHLIEQLDDAYLASHGEQKD
jgi:hypothetical protein